MRTLNVFKLARNVDYNLAHNIRSTTGDCKFQENIVDEDFPKYTQIDPECIMAEKEPKNNILDVRNVNLQTTNVNECHYETVQVNTQNATDNVHNGHNGVHDVPEPESYKRLINEAPFMTTSREPPIPIGDLDHDASETCNQDMTDGTKTKASSISNGSKSDRSSRVSIHTSSISMSCTSTSFDLELDWVDTKLIKEGRAFIRRNFLSVMFAHFIGIAFLFAVRPVAAILLRNGKFHKPAKRHWHLYLHSFRKLKSWYEKGDLTDTSDPSTVEVLHLRRCICTAGKNFKKFLPPPAQDLELSKEEETFQRAIKQDLSAVKDIQVELKNIAKIFATVNPDVPWSQYDLAMTQFAFFGFVSLFPRAFGIYDRKDGVGMKGFIHLWAVLGHLLGLENRFNLCKEENFDEETNKKIFKHVFLFSFKIIDNGSFRMLQLMCDGSKWFTIFISRIQLVLLFMVQEVAQVTSTKNLESAIKWQIRVQFSGFRFWTHWLVRIFFLRILGNLLSRIILSFAYAILLVQIKWKRWKIHRKPAQMTVFPSSVSLTLKT